MNRNICLEQTVHKHKAGQPALPAGGGRARDAGELHAGGGGAARAAAGARGGARAPRPAAGQGRAHHAGRRAPPPAAGHRAQDTQRAVHLRALARGRGGGAGILHTAC